MPLDYIPARDTDLVVWSANMKAKIVASPLIYGLTAGQATSYGTKHDTFAAALTTASNPSTRTSSSVISKDVARADLVADARALAGICENYPSITPVLLNDLGLTVRDNSRTPVAAPTTKPVVSVELIKNLEHLLRVRDEATPTSMQRPPGAIGCEVWIKIGGTEPLSVSECVYKGLATRVPFAVEFAPGDENKTVWYLCRWITAHGETGPNSDQISGSIAA